MADAQRMAENFEVGKEPRACDVRSRRQRRHQVGNGGREWKSWSELSWCWWWP